MSSPDLPTSSPGSPHSPSHYAAPEAGPSTSSADNSSLEPADVLEDVLSDQQLREQYEAEEIQYFLHLFSNHVKEVRAADLPPDNSFKSDITNADDRLQECDPESTNKPKLTDEVPPRYESQSVKPVGLAELIALRVILPNLPPTQRYVPPFTLGRLRQTSERLYLIIQSIYIPFATKLFKLSTWEDRNKSLRYCILYWILWWHNFLLPALILSTFYSISRRKLLEYPTLSELRRRQEQINQAGKFGDQVTARLSTPSNFGGRELWRFFRSVTAGKKEKNRPTPKDTGKREDDSSEVTEGIAEDATIVEDVSDEASDLKRFGLQSLSEVADFHERVRNLFIWRRPSSSRTYSMFLIFFFFVILFTPTQYLVKTINFVCGFLFWHVIPVLVALPSAERSRLPPVLADIPTDAEYAMEIITRRVAEGLPVSPLRLGKKHQKRSSKNTDEVGTDSAQQLPKSKADGEDVDTTEWKKWSDRLNTGRSLAAQGKRLFTGKVEPINESSTAILTFPAQFNSTPGVIDLTSTTLKFTPLLSQTVKLSIPLGSMKSVKKTTVLKGLDITWTELSETSGRNQRNERFMWIGGRDELFARLISISGRNWIKV